MTALGGSVVELRLEGASPGVRATLSFGRRTDYQIGAALLHESESAQIAQFSFERRRDDFALGRLCAKAALGGYLKRTNLQDICVRAGELGQPWVDGVQGVGVSISHRAGLGAAVAFSEGCPLGIDIEPLTRDSESEPPAFERDEALLAWRFEDLRTAKVALFTAKEALGKVLRTGLAVSPELLEVGDVERRGAAYVCSFRHVLPFQTTSVMLRDHVITIAHPKSVRVTLEFPNKLVRRERPDVEVERLPFVLMFSGQGSQYFHMASELFQTSAVFRLWMERGNEYVKSKHGIDVLSHLYSTAHTKATSFAAGTCSNAAIIMVEVAVAWALHELGFRPQVVLGASLGEIAAAVASDALDLESALDLAVHLALVMEERGLPGRMFAVMAPVQEALRVGLGAWELASEFQHHFVASVLAEHVASFEASLARVGLRYQDIGVAYPFHSSGIDAAYDPVVGFARKLVMRAPQARFVSCATGGRLTTLTADHIWRAIREPIHFRRTVSSLAEASQWLFVDAGPSGSLAGHVRQQLPSMTALATLNPFGHDQRSFGAAVSAIGALRSSHERSAWAAGA